MINFKQKIAISVALCVLSSTAFASPAQADGFAISQAPTVLADALMDKVGSDDIRLATARFSVAGTNKHYGLAEIGVADIIGDYNLVNVTTSYGNRFSAVLSSENQKIAVQGRYDDYVEVPVVIGSFSKGEIVGKADIQWVSMPSNRVRRNVVTNADHLIGMEVTRRLTSGKPVLMRDVRKPVLVKKGSIVKIVYRTEFIDLRTSGLALQNAAAGDVIRVKNSKSGVMLQVMINNRGEAVVNYGDAMEQLSRNQMSRKRG